MKKRLLSLALALVMALSLLPAAAAANLTPLDTPTELTWGVGYRGEERPMAMSWKIPALHQEQYILQIYRVGVTAPVATVYPFFQSTETTGFSYYFNEGEDFQESGTYYFTVKCRGDNTVYADSAVATSPEITYTKPSTKLAAPTNLSWNWPVGMGDKPANTENVGGFEFDFYYAETESGWKQSIGTVIQSARSVQGWADIYANNYGTGYYWFKVRSLAQDITQDQNSDWSDFSPVYFLDLNSIANRLDAILNDFSLDEAGIRAAVQALDRNELELALRTDPKVSETLTYLEEGVLGEKPVVVDTTNAPAGLPRDGIAILGAGLNDVTGDEVKLTVAAASKSDLTVPPTLAHNTLNVKFSMNLTGVQNPKELKVPVLVTLPVPVNVNPDFLHIVHYLSGGGYEILQDEDLMFSVSETGQRLVSFVVNGFSDFALIEADPDENPDPGPDEPIVVPKVSLKKSMFEVDTADVVYNGQAQQPKVEAKNAGDSMNTDIPQLGRDYTVSYTDNRDVGTATITITGMGEYYYDTSLTYTFKITPKPLVITGASVADKTYDGKTDASVTAVTFDSALTGDDYTATAAFADPKAGQGKTATVTVTLKNKNYSLAAKTFQTTASIARAALSNLQAAAVLKETAGSTAAVELSALPLPKGETFTFALASSSNVTAEVNGKNLTLTTPDSVSGSKAAVTVTGESENYTATVNVAVTYTDKTPVALSGIRVADKTYDGKPIAYTGTLTVTDREANSPVTVDAAAVSYEWFAASNMGAALTGRAPTDAGDYVLLVTVDTSKVTTTPDPAPDPGPGETTDPDGGESLPAAQSDGEEYYGVASLPVTISKAAVTVKADNKSIKVNAALPAFTCTVTGLVGVDQPDDVWQTRPVAVSAGADAAKAGTYTITVTPGVLKADVAKNHSVNYVDGTLTVSKSSGGGGGSSGGSSSGGSSSSTQYAVSVPKQPDNGKVTLSAEKGKSGSTVTLTVTPDEGYRLEKLTVTDKNGKTLTLTDKGGGKFTFTMPASKVEVSATFAKEEKKAEPTTVTSAEPITKRFNDIKETNWYRDAVQYVYDRGMMNGMTPKNFEPAASASRAMLVTILYRMEGEPETGGASFSDVADWMYYADSVAWATEKGIVTGHEDGTFQPDNEVTREQIVSMLYRYARLKGYDTSLGDRSTNFVDAADVDDYAQEAVRWAASIGLVNGYQDGSFRPGGKTARAEVAVILMRFCEGVAKTEG